MPCDPDHDGAVVRQANLRNATPVRSGWPAVPVGTVCATEMLSLQSYAHLRPDDGEWMGDAAGGLNLLPTTAP